MIEHVERMRGLLEEIKAEVRQLERVEVEVRRQLEEALGRTPDPARSTLQLACELAVIALEQRELADMIGRHENNRVGVLERAIVDAVGILACEDLHGDETTLAARQVFADLDIPGLVMVSRCGECSEPIEGEPERCPDCKAKLADNLISGLEVGGEEELA